MEAQIRNDNQGPSPGYQDALQAKLSIPQNSVDTSDVSILMPVPPNNTLNSSHDSSGFSSNYQPPSEIKERLQNIQDESDEADIEEDDYQYDENDIIDDNEVPSGHHDKLTMTPKKPTPANLVTSPMDASPTDTGSSLRGAD